MSPYWRYWTSGTGWNTKGAVTGNKWWGSLKYRIRNFTIKYGQQLNRDRTKIAKLLQDKLSLALETGGFLSY